MKYPYYSNFIDVYGPLPFDRYRVYEKVADEYKVAESYEVRLARVFDGRTPDEDILKSFTEEEQQECLNILKAKGLIRRDHGFSLFGRITLHKALYISSVNKISRRLACIYNKILMMLFVPLSFIGIFALMRIDKPLFGWNPITITSYFMGIFLGIVLHELSHALAGITYNVDVFEFGIQILPVPAGYTMMDSETVSSGWSKIQIFAAGIESNLLFAGILFIIATFSRPLRELCLPAAYINLALSITNLLPFKGHDGLKVLRILRESGKKRDRI